MLDEVDRGAKVGVVAGGPSAPVGWAPALEITEALVARAHRVDAAGDAGDRWGVVPTPAPTMSRSTAGRWRAPVTAAAGLVAVTVLAASLVGGRASVDPAAAPPAVTSEPAPPPTSAAEKATPSGGGSPTADPGPTSPAGLLVVPASPALGLAYPFDLLTHCGVLGTDIGGVYFAAEQPLPEGPDGQPTGWAKPYQRGSMTLLSTTEAEFTDTTGHTARFHVDPTTTAPVPCD